jgi:glycosyltransferase involved in cell wall biosynthesis
VGPTYSIVIPVLDEEATLAELHRRVTGVMERLDGPAELVVVDDGSTDGSWEVIRDLARRDPRVRPVRLSRNWGHQIAITAGMDHALGDAVVVMDADLQDPPEVVLEMARRWREGAQVVYARRARRAGESRAKRATAAGFYRVLDRISEVPIPRDVGDFRLMDRVVVDAVGHMREHNRYLRGMVAWAGYRQDEVTYDRDARHAGATKFSLSRMLRFATDGVLSFSAAPLRLALRVGLLVSAVSFAYGVVAVLLKVTGAFTVPGWTSLVVVVALMGGMQLVVLGVMGEYIARIHDEVKARPLYLTQPPEAEARSGPDDAGADRLEAPPGHLGVEPGGAEPDHHL